MLMHPSPDPAIYCLLQSTDAHPGLGEAVAPPGLLSAAEQARCDGFVIAKRRRDWLLGRWTAKHLVQSHLSLAQHIVFPLSQIEILADDDGAPFAQIGARLPLSLSISHSGADSFCALCPDDAGAVGADVEQIEPRELSFVRTFFTAAENHAVDEAASGPERDALVTALWSAKEAVLKTLRLGLRADTRQVEVQLPGLDSAWQSLQVATDPILLSRPPSVLSAWLQRRGNRILSLALLHA